MGIRVRQYWQLRHPISGAWAEPPPGRQNAVPFKPVLRWLLPLESRDAFLVCGYFRTPLMTAMRHAQMPKYSDLCELSNQHRNYYVYCCRAVQSRGSIQASMLATFIHGAKRTRWNGVRIHHLLKTPLSRQWA